VSRHTKGTDEEGGAGSTSEYTDEVEEERRTGRKTNSNWTGLSNRPDLSIHSDLEETNLLLRLQGGSPSPNRTIHQNRFPYYVPSEEEKRRLGQFMGCSTLSLEEGKPRDALVIHDNQIKRREHGRGEERKISVLYVSTRWHETPEPLTRNKDLTKRLKYRNRDQAKRQFLLCAGQEDGASKITKSACAIYVHGNP